MPSLRELQLRFAASLLDEAGNYCAAHVAGRTIAAGDRIGFYRNNVASNFRGTLRAVYPVIARLVGTAFFDRAADRYARVYPSASGDLNRFGEHFADFLETYPPAGNLQYLADVARLEWLVELAFYAADREPLRIADLGAVPPDRQELLTFELHPATRTLASRFPIQRIRETNQPEWDSGASVDLGEGGVFLVVGRQGHQVFVESVDHGSFCMLSLFAAGRNLGEACRYAMSVQPDFDVSAFLVRHTANGTLTAFDWPITDMTGSGDAAGAPMAAAA